MRGRRACCFSGAKCAASGGDAGGVETEIGEQFATTAVLDEAVGDAQAAHAAGVETCVGGGFQDRAAEPAHERAFLDDHGKRRLLDGPEQRIGIERLDETGVDHADIESLAGQLVRRLPPRP